MPKKKRALKLFLLDILDAIQDIRTFTVNHTFESFIRDKMCCDAVVWKMSIIGEAVRNIPESFYETYPEIPWYRLRGFRNRVVHAYFDVDLALIWQITQHHLPELNTHLERIIREFQGDELV